MLSFLACTSQEHLLGACVHFILSTATNIIIVVSIIIDNQRSLPCRSVMWILPISVACHLLIAMQIIV